MGETVNQFWQQIAELGLLPDLRGLSHDAREKARGQANEHADSTLLLKAVLAAGLMPNVLHVTAGKHFPQLSQQKQTVQIHPSSFNHRVAKFDTSYMVYHEKVKTTGKIFVHDCTAVTALDLVLFGAEPQVLHAQHRVLIDGWIDIRISPRTAVLFKALRRQISELMRQRIAEVGEAAPKPLLAGDAATAAHTAAARAAQTDVLSAIISLIKRGAALAEPDDFAGAASSGKSSGGAKGGGQGRGGRGR